MKLLSIACMVSASFLTGCASPVGMHRSSLAGSTAVTAVRDLHPEVLQVGSPVRSELDEKSAVLAIAGGKSYGALYSLDTASKAASIHILGDCHCGYAGSAYWLFPQVTVYDEKFNPIATGPELALHNRVKTSYWSERIVVEGSLTLPPSSGAKIYVLVHTTPDLMKKGVSMTISSQQVTVLGEMAVASGTNTTSFVVPASPQGSFELAALPAGRLYPDDAEREEPPYGVIVDMSSD